MIRDDYILHIDDKELEDWEIEAKAKIRTMPEGGRETRKRARNDLVFFATLFNPGYMYGQIHRDIYREMEKYTLFENTSTISANKLIMLPRAHLKSHMLDTWCCWIITRHPEITIFYVSATAELSLIQLESIKNKLGGSTYRRYFPEYVNPQEGKRRKWSANKIVIDHHYRRKEGIRDATIATAGLTTVTTGWHADVILADDLVVPENAYSEDGRSAVSRKSSQFTSIRNAGGFTMAAGTRYHPSDVYASWKEQIYDVYDDTGELTDRQPVWEIIEHVVEVDGLFLWPRMVREDNKAFGFDWAVLARIKAEYGTDITQYHAQYYNDPNDPSSDRINRDRFQYANRRLLKKEGRNWFYNGKRLNIYAAVDFAFSLTKGADFSAIVVVGVDSESNYYVVDIDRFKTNKVLEYFQRILALHSQWHFKKLRAETTVAQEVIVEAIKDYIKKSGTTLSIDSYRPNRHEGSKDERIAAAIEHRYDNLQMYHFEGGFTKQLEEELVQARPSHDDLKDALACAVTISVSPAKSHKDRIKDFLTVKTTGSRFGGRLQARTI